MRWPILSLPLPSGPGIAISVVYFGPLPVTPKENSYILLFTDPRRIPTFSFSPTVSAGAQTCTPSLQPIHGRGHRRHSIQQVHPTLGMPRSLLSDNGLQFCSKLSHAVSKLLGTRKIATSSYHPNGNGGIERVNHTMAQMLAKVVNERQDD